MQKIEPSDTELWPQFIQDTVSKKKWHQSTFLESLRDEVIEKVKNNLRVIKQLKRGKKLQSPGENVLMLPNKVFSSYPFNAEDLKWTVTRFIWIIRSSRILKPENNLKLTILSAKLQASASIYKNSLAVLKQTYTDLKDEKTCQELTKIIEKFDRKVPKEILRKHVEETHAGFKEYRSENQVVDATVDTTSEEVNEH